jgi:hypothetical protein
MRHALFLFLTIATPVVNAQAPTPAQARAVFAEAESACRGDDGALWGRSLCLPLLLVDPATRTVMSSAAGTGDSLVERDGIFVGRLPERINIANTALDWEGQRRAMLVWPLPEDARERKALLMHESWHGVQEALGLPARSPNPAHLSSVTGRIGMRLEWRALAAALRARDARAERLAISDALAFRAWRRQLDPQAGLLENHLELNEGLAEYTGQQLSGRARLDEHIAAGLAIRESDPSFVRSFAYGSGPAYGRLLDRHAPGWRRSVHAGDDLGERLAAALGLGAAAEAPALPAEAAGRHGHAQVQAEEDALEAQRLAAAKRWRDRLVDGPTVFLPFRRMNISFDPGSLFALPPEGTVYPTLRVVDEWGVLEAEQGALIGDDWSGVRLPGPATLDGNVVRGPGWSLPLAGGWRLDATAQRIEKP